MSHTNRAALALPAPDNTIKNDAPPLLLQLAKAAIFAGFEEVHLGFEGLGSDEPAPIGWTLLLAKRSAETLHWLNSKEHPNPSQLDQRMQMRVSVRREGLIGEGKYSEAQAYVGHGGVYWNAEQISEWINTEHHLAAEERQLFGLADGDQLITEESAQAAYDRLEAAYSNGWSVRHRLKTDMGLLFRRFKPTFGLLAMSLESINGFYNTEGHPQDRDAGGKHTVTHCVIRADSQSSDLGPAATLLSDVDYEPIQAGSIDNFEESGFGMALRNTAPWFVRVAGYVDYDEESDTGDHWQWPAEARPTCN